MFLVEFVEGSFEVPDLGREMAVGFAEVLFRGEFCLLLLEEGLVLLRVLGQFLGRDFDFVRVSNEQTRVVLCYNDRKR